MKSCTPVPSGPFCRTDREECSATMLRSKLLLSASTSVQMCNSAWRWEFRMCARHCERELIEIDPHSKWVIDLHSKFVIQQLSERELIVIEQHSKRELIVVELVVILLVVIRSDFNACVEASLLASG
jgi:hypothetical protein